MGRDHLASSESSVQNSRQQQTVTNRVTKMNQDNRKTEMCRNLLESGVCRWGQNCHFAHSEDEKRHRPRPKGYKTRLCKNFFERGHCVYGLRCHFAHSIVELEATHNTAIPATQTAARGIGTGTEVTLYPFVRKQSDHQRRESLKEPLAPNVDDDDIDIEEEQLLFEVSQLCLSEEEPDYSDEEDSTFKEDASLLWSAESDLLWRPIYERPALLQRYLVAS